MEGKTKGWSEPYLGGQYLDGSRSDLYLGVHDFGSFAECHVWTPGCGFSPQKTDHETAAEARAYGEAALARIDVGAQAVAA